MSRYETTYAWKVCMQRDDTVPPVGPFSIPPWGTIPKDARCYCCKIKCAGPFHFEACRGCASPICKRCLTDHLCMICTQPTRPPPMPTFDPTHTCSECSKPTVDRCGDCNRVYCKACCYLIPYQDDQGRPYVQLMCILCAPTPQSLPSTESFGSRGPPGPPQDTPETHSTTAASSTEAIWF